MLEAPIADHPARARHSDLATATRLREPARSGVIRRRARRGRLRQCSRERAGSGACEGVDADEVVQAATLTVCASGCDQTTIAAAIAVAIAGDTISVGDVVHLETGAEAAGLTNAAGAGQDLHPTLRGRLDVDVRYPISSQMMRAAACWEDFTPVRGQHKPGHLRRRRVVTNEGVPQGAGLGYVEHGGYAATRITCGSMRT